MNQKLIHKICGAFVFIFTVVIYYITMQPTFALWDPGEYTSVSYTLGIPHPPGTPFNVIIGKIFSFIPLFSDMGARIAFNSVISSTFAVLLVYLISVKIITYWRGKPKDNFDSFVICFVSAISALALAFCGSYWFNALETEAESKAILFIALMIWLALIWRERADEPGSDRFILLCCFLIGLGVGSHLLVAQTIIVIVLFYYFTKYEYSHKSFLIASGIAALAFLTVFPVIIIKLPKLFGASSIVAIIVLFILLWGVFYSEKKKVALLKFTLLSITFIVLGYSLYITVFLRASVDNLPVNQNNPRTTDAFVSYVSREQYGEQPVFWPRRYSQQPQHQPTWRNYSSDSEFMFKYQINEMYIRYLLWQFIGRAGYDQGDGIDFKKLYAIPFMFGLIGIFYLTKKDRKTGFILIATFLLFGILTALYQNQQDPQPRERDYFYVVSYMVFCLWIGHGVLYIVDLIKEKIKTGSSKLIISLAILISFIIVPVNMLKANYFYQDRSGNYLPFDYAYNILQSVEKDGILITNGDNDTFPLWCLQAVYGIRTDVRIVNLSLANLEWYNLQLKNEQPYGTQTVPFTYTNDQLKKLRPVMWDENKPVSLSVPPEAYPDTMQVKPDKINFNVPATIRQRQGNQVITALQVNDLILLDIIKANNWKRPIFFSATVMDFYCVGLSGYLRFEGMAKKLMPFKLDQNSGRSVNIDITSKCYLTSPKEISKTPAYGFLFRNTNNSKVFYEEVHRKIIDAYRDPYFRLASACTLDSLNYKTAKETILKMEENIPRKVIPMDYRFKYKITLLLYKINEIQLFNEYASEVEKSALEDLKANPGNIAFNEYNPCTILVNIYDAKQDYGKAYEYLKKIYDKNPYDQTVIEKLNVLKQKLGM